SFLDDSVPLDRASWADVTGFDIAMGRLADTLENGEITGPLDGAQLAGYRREPSAPSAILLGKTGLHLEIGIERASPIGKADKAGIADMVLESALTTIQDCADSVAAVDAEDKVTVYRNWLGLMKGDLEEKIEKDGKTFTRKLSA